MRRGFKSWAERQATEQRQALGLTPIAPLAAERLAAHHSIEIQSPGDVPGMSSEHLTWLLRDGLSDWSAITLQTRLGRLIILNTAHPSPRQQSDLMHEIAHILCDHRPSTRIPLAGAPHVLRGYDSALEEEAAWLGACLQIPRSALSWAANRRMSEQQIAEHFLASVELVRFRRNVTGIDRQFGRRANGW